MFHQMLMLTVMINYSNAAAAADDDDKREVISFTI
jgi:hypothetical protein